MYNDYTYDGLNRLDGVDYLVNDYSSTDDGTDDFVMDDLGNRTGDQTLRDVTVGYTVNNDTNRYTAIGTGSPAHDNAGNLTTDHRGYDYYYDYENRIMLIEDAESTTIASFGYDALGRRIRKTDYTAPGDPCDQQTLYYYNAAWQVLTEHDGTGYFRRLFVYGNYIDEVLLMDDGTNDHYYAHNHLFSTVALLDDTGSTVERYEYDAYGKATMLNPDFTAFTGTAAGNPYTFTGRRLDSLDGGDLSIMYYRNRYYDAETGRFLQQDPLGIDPGISSNNWFMPRRQYTDGLNLHEYVNGRVVISFDPMGLIKGYWDISAAVDMDSCLEMCKDLRDEYFRDVVAANKCFVAALEKVREGGYALCDAQFPPSGAITAENPLDANANCKILVDIGLAAPKYSEFAIYMEALIAGWVGYGQCNFACVAAFGEPERESPWIIIIDPILGQPGGIYPNPRR